MKQAPRAWNKILYGFSKEIGFEKCVPVHGVYVKKDANDGMIILRFYVGDLLIIGRDENFFFKFKIGLMKEFEMTDLGLMTYFLSIEFYNSKKRLLMPQTRYALEILKKFEMKHCNIVITPIEPRLQKE